MNYYIAVKEEDFAMKECIAGREQIEIGVKEIDSPQPSNRLSKSLVRHEHQGYFVNHERRLFCT